MVKNILLACGAAVFVLAAGVPVMAHHSANAQFDTSVEKVLTGVLTRLEEVNPHSQWYVDVKGADGTVTSWKLESVNPNTLRRQGVKVKDDLKIGEPYGFTISPSRDGTNTGFLKAIQIKDRLVQLLQL
jgi:hypothetical protein